MRTPVVDGRGGEGLGHELNLDIFGHAHLFGIDCGNGTPLPSLTCRTTVRR